MGKELLKKATLAAGEKVARSLLPELMDELREFRDSVEGRLTKLEHSVHQVQIELLRELTDRHERLVSVMGELAQRISHLEGSLGRLGGSVDRQTDRMELWIERTVRVETLQERQTPPRKRKAV